MCDKSFPEVWKVKSNSESSTAVLLLVYKNIQFDISHF